MKQHRQMSLRELWSDDLRDEYVGNALTAVNGINPSGRAQKRKAHRVQGRSARDKIGQNRSRPTDARQVLLTDLWPARLDTDLHGDDAQGVIVKWPHSIEQISQVSNPHSIAFENDAPSEFCGCQDQCRFVSCRNARQGFFCSSSCCRDGDTCALSPSNNVDLQLARSRFVDGYGVIASRAIAAGVVIGEYVGEMKALDSEEELADQTYALELKAQPLGLGRKKAFIDAAEKGNITRFINHSCDASSVFQELQNGSHVAVVVVSRRVIHASEEVTVDYGRKAKFHCMCGTKKCRRPGIGLYIKG